MSTLTEIIVALREIDRNRNEISGLDNELIKLRSRDPESDALKVAGFILGQGNDPSLEKTPETEAIEKRKRELEKRNEILAEVLNRQLAELGGGTSIDSWLELFRHKQQLDRELAKLNDSQRMWKYTDREERRPSLFPGGEEWLRDNKKQIRVIKRRLKLVNDRLARMQKIPLEVMPPNATKAVRAEVASPAIVPSKDLAAALRDVHHDHQREEFRRITNIILPQFDEKLAPPVQEVSISPSEARARTVATIIEELNILKPQMYGASDYGRLASEHPDYLTFQVAMKRPDLKLKVINILASRRHYRLALELAAACHGKELSTLQTDWKRHKPEAFRQKKAESGQHTSGQRKKHEPKTFRQRPT